MGDHRINYDTSRLTRRTFCALTAASAAGALVGTLAACDRKSSSASTNAPKELIIYCSADSDLAEPIFAAFTKQTGIAIKPVFDTEATKTTGLVNRLLQEKDSPRADAWWSSEPFGTIRLARAGVLAPYTSAAAEEQMKVSGGWPKQLRGKDNLWYGFGSRARVFVYNTKLVKAEDVPQRLNDLTRSKFKGRVGIARPQFGTTSGHMAAIYTLFEQGVLRDWLKALKANDVRLFDGNAAVARAVGNGEIYVGLADTDDVFAGQREGWPIDLRFEPREEARAVRVTDIGFAAGMGTLLLPNTVALVRGGPNAESGGRLIDFLLSPSAQRMMAESDSHNMPVAPALAAEFAKWGPKPEEIANLDFEKAADAMMDAMAVCDDVLGN